MINFKIELQLEGNGWLKIELNLSGFYYEFMASDLGPDPIEQLISVALNLINIDEKPEYFTDTVECYGEPSGLNIAFIPSGNELQISLYFLEDSDLSPKGDLGKKLASGLVEIENCCEEIYLTVKNVLRQNGFLYYFNHWHEFPIGMFIGLHNSLQKRPTIPEGNISTELRSLENILTF